MRVFKALLLAAGGIVARTDLLRLERDGTSGGFRVAWDAATYTMMSMRTFALWWARDGTLQAYVPAPDQADPGGREWSCRP